MPFPPLALLAHREKMPPGVISGHGLRVGVGERGLVRGCWCDKGGWCSRLVHVSVANWFTALGGRVYGRLF